MDIGHDTDTHATERTRVDAPAARGPRWLLLGNSRAMRTLRADLARIAPIDSTVLIAGEPGTCKDLYAAEVHRRSGRDGPFIVLEPHGLVDGAAQGAGGNDAAAALARAPFEYARRGTLFVADVTALAPVSQVRLLQALEAGRSRAAHAAGRDADVRVIAAASREPLEAVSDGGLREDLYDFLSELTLHVPPLREREEDVLPLAKTFLETLNRTHRTARRLDDAAARALAARPWPGNVRELRRVVEQSYARAEGFDAVLRIDAPGDGAGELELRAGVPISTMERRLIELTLAHFNGDKRRAAAALGISVRTIYNRLRQYRSEPARD